MRIPSPSSARPRAFLIYPFNLGTFSPETLYAAIQQRLSNQSFDEIVAILDNVKIHRAFEFDGILEAVAKVSDALYQLQHQGQQDHERKVLAQMSRELREGSDEPVLGSSSAEEPILLIVEGIDRSLEETIRESGPLAGHARLMPLVRSLAILSRTYASFLTVLVVNSICLSCLSLPFLESRIGSQADTNNNNNSRVLDRSANGTIEVQGHGKEHNIYDQKYPAQNHPPFSHHRHRPSNDTSIGTPSIFSADLSLSPPPSPNPSAPTFLHSWVLSRSMDQGFDTHLLVSKVQGNMVVEVAKDRVGDRVGRWCIWDGLKQ